MGIALNSYHPNLKFSRERAQEIPRQWNSIEWFNLHVFSQSIPQSK